MVRKNDKQQLISYENSIKKSNEFSMAKLSQKLTLNQMQLLAFAIYSTQQNGKTEFIKADFERKFNLAEYRREEAKEDSRKLFELEFSLDDIETGEFDYLHVFQRINFKKGLFTFKWSEDIVPHILDLKDRYITNGFLTIANFKSGFSWILYDYLKGNYGYWRKVLSKEALMKLFCVEDKKTYQKNTGEFKRGVLDVAIAEINKYTELEVSYKVEKEGRAIVGFELIWSTGEPVASATKKQIKALKATIDIVFEDTYKYVNLNDKNKREKAIQLMRELENYKEYVTEPTCITKEKADSLIVNANAYLRELENFSEEDRNAPPFYDWLNQKLKE